MSEQTMQLVARLRDRLRRTARRIRLADLTFGLALLLGLLAATWLLATAAEASLWMPSVARVVLLSLGTFVGGAFAGYLVVVPALRLAGLLPNLPDEAVARRVGTRYPEVSDRLVNLLQLAEGRGSFAPAPMVDRAVQALGREVQPVPFERVEDFSDARRVSRLATLPLVGVALFLLVAPDVFLGASSRLLAPAEHFQRPAPFRLLVTPGATDVVRGDSLPVTVHAHGTDVPQTVTLHLNHTGEEHTETVTLTADSVGRYRHILASLRTSLRYRATAGRVETAWFGVNVHERPMVRTLQLTLRPPAYTGLPAHSLPPQVGDVTALPGTRVDLEATLDGPDTETATLLFDSGRADTLALDGGTATGTFVMRGDGRYRLGLQSHEGVLNEAPIAYRLEALTDAPPEIQLTAPPATTALGDDREAALRFRMSDDYGFSQLRLYYRLAERRFGEPMDEFAFVELPVDDPRALEQALAYTWRLTETTPLDLVPGDVVEYHVRVWDNNAFAGYQPAQTATQRLEVPSMAEKYERLDEQQDEVDTQLGDLQRTQEAVREQFEALRDELRRNQTSTWQDERQLERLQQQQQQLERGVEEAASQIEEVTQQMRDQNLTSPETQRLYEELQQVTREVNAPELMEALDQLQEAMQHMDLEQMQEAIQQFEFSEEEYRERLERTLDLFKQLRAQQKLEEAARRAGELQRRQEQLAASTRQLEQEENTPDSSAAPGPPARPEANSDDEASPDEGAQPQTAPQEGAPDEGAPPQERGDQQAQGEQPPDQQAQGEPPPDQQAPGAEQLAREQDRAGEEMRTLEEMLDELQEEMGALRQSPREQMQQLAEQRQQQLAEQMQRNSQQLRQGQLRQAQQGQQQMAQQLQQMQQQMQQMQQQMQQDKQQIDLSALRQALSTTLALSERQEALRRDVERVAGESSALRDYAQQQQQLQEGLRVLSDSLQQVARSVPQMTRAVQQSTGQGLRSMAASVEALTDRARQQAEGHQQASMARLNELALQLANLAERLQNQQGQGGGMSAQQMAQQLQQMAGQQQQLNQQVQQMLNDMQGNRLSIDQQQRLQQMAQQQRALRQQTDQLKRESSTAGRQLLGDLDRIAEQMQQTIDEMQRNQLDPRTPERQQQILSRLLDAQRSLRQQDRDPQREGRHPEETLRREDPAALSPEERVDRLRRDLIRALESGYAPDYEELIKRYFRLLRELEESP